MSLNNVNIISVLLLGARVAAAAAAISLSYEHKAWLMLSWISTVAGNLSLLGSAANLIVCEQARRAPHLTYNLSFLETSQIWGPLHAHSHCNWFDSHPEQ